MTELEKQLRALAHAANDLRVLEPRGTRMRSFYRGVSQGFFEAADLVNRRAKEGNSDD